MAHAEIFTALADPTRRHIFESLRERPKSVNELAQGQTVSRPAVSQHLKVLQSSGLVSVKPRGNFRMYKIRQEGLAELKSYLESFWCDAMTAYEVEIKRQIKNQKEIL